MARLLLVILAAVAVAYLGRDALEGPVRGARVLRVVDGDTLHVSVRGRDRTVRLIGIDTPEVDPPECGARAAARALDRLAGGRRVTLRADPTQDRRDRYGRLLRYLEVGGADVGERLVRLGWARVYVYDSAFTRLARYRAAARRAPRRC